MNTEKIKPSKLTLSLITYLLCYPVCFIILSIIQSLLVNFLTGVADSFFLFEFILRLLSDDGIIGSISFVWVFILSALIPYSISQKINSEYERTHNLSTFIMGIILTVIQGLFLIINIVTGNYTPVNLFHTIVGIVLIVNGKKFLN